MVVATPGRLRGQEVRFIRSMLDLSQKQLADRLGVSRVTVARWEGKSSTPIPGAADRLLRMIYAIEMFTADGVEHVYSMLTEISGPLPERMEMVYAAASSEEEPELFDNNGGGPTWTKKAA
ncbi:MAG: helix-turn-helix domain-containing protein [Rhodospirillales bacterium]|nr:helix-turn-helix domain-containing protein [Rhodospirillales bacterium]